MMTASTTIDVIADTLGRLDGVTVERSVPAGRFCTYRVGGPLAVLATVHTPTAAASVAAALAGSDVATMAIGNGSNLLVADAGFPGVAIHLTGACEDVEIDDADDSSGTSIVHAGAAALLPRVARATVAAGCAGFEWAVGVPGTIGGAVCMNAGGHGSDMAASVVSIDQVDLRTGERTTRPASDLGFGYRESNLGGGELVLAAALRLDRGDRTEGERTLSEIVAWRRANQPGGANAGSVFTNPPGDSAGRLIDHSGAKGRRVGTAEVSTKHANFIQADVDGSADDIVELMAQLVDLVEGEHGVRLTAETRLVGFSPERVAHVQNGGQR